MIKKILWEVFSVLLLLYGLYLGYVFAWFSLYRIFDMPTFLAKLISGIVAIGILVYSSYNWFKKKHKEIEELKQQTEPQ
jgi:uncharacterized protein YacL